MLRNVITSRAPALSWIDIVSPKLEELSEIGETYGLHPISIEHCLDPEHLPKFEKIGGTVFVIARAYDDHVVHGDSVQALTRKLAIFFGSQFVVSVHRREQEFFTRIVERYRDPEESGCTLEPVPIVIDLLLGVVRTFERPLRTAEEAVDRIESSLFSNNASPADLREMYFLKRRISIMKRTLWSTKAIVEELVPYAAHVAPLLQDLKENTERLESLAVQLLENAGSLINIHISMQSQRTNEVMRVLTLFSVFFMPLTFIVGVYGMNFDYMPELRQPYGYHIVVLVMVSVSFVLWLWFRRKGWLR